MKKVHKFPRYTVWADETLLDNDKAVFQGLVYGVYDNAENEKCTDEKQGGVITSYHQAQIRAQYMNKQLVDPKFY